MPRNCEKSGKLHTYATTPRSEPIVICPAPGVVQQLWICLFQKMTNQTSILDFSQPCKVGSGENLRLLFVQAQFSTPYISMMFTKLWYSKFWKIVSPIWTSPGFLNRQLYVLLFSISVRIDFWGWKIPISAAFYPFFGHFRSEGPSVLLLELAERSNDGPKDRKWPKNG